MEQKIDFGESLREILNNNNIQVKDIAKQIGVSLETIYSWLKNNTEPNLSYLISMADFFECSIEYLIGRTVDKNYIDVKSYPPFSKRVQFVLREVGISTYELKQTTKYDGGYFYKWKRGSQPLLSTLIELARIADCTVDYLVGRI